MFYILLMIRISEGASGYINQYLSPSFSAPNVHFESVKKNSIIEWDRHVLVKRKELRRSSNRAAQFVT